jgi:hypothetical protein
MRSPVPDWRGYVALVLFCALIALALVVVALAMQSAGIVPQISP